MLSIDLYVDFDPIIFVLFVKSNDALQRHDQEFVIKIVIEAIFN